MTMGCSLTDLVGNPFSLGCLCSQRDINEGPRSRRLLHAVVSGQGSRGVPFSRRVPTTVALGLIELGFPSLILCNPATVQD